MGKHLSEFPSIRSRSPAAPLRLPIFAPQGRRSASARLNLFQRGSFILVTAPDSDGMENRSPTMRNPKAPTQAGRSKSSGDWPAKTCSARLVHLGTAVADGIKDQLHGTSPLCLLGEFEWNDMLLAKVGNHVGITSNTVMPVPVRFAYEPVGASGNLVCQSSVVGLQLQKRTLSRLALATVSREYCASSARTCRFS